MISRCDYQSSCKCTDIWFLDKVEGRASTDSCSEMMSVRKWFPCMARLSQKCRVNNEGFILILEQNLDVIEAL